MLYIKDEKCFLYDGVKLTKTDLSKAKKHPVALLVPPSALYFHTQKISTSIDYERKQGTMEISMYAEGAADENEEYAKAIVSHSLPDGSNDLVELFGITYSLSEKLYGDIAEQIKAIDVMVPAFFIYESLYEEDAPESTDLYIFLGDEEAYATLYVNGKYKAFRTIENFSNLSSQCGWDLDTLKAALKTRGVVEDSYPPEEHLFLTKIQEGLTKSIEKIINSVNHKRGLFGIDKVDRIFLDFEGAKIPGLENIFAAYEVEVDAIEPVCGSKEEKPSLCHDNIGAKYLHKVLKDKLDCANITPYKRKLPFYKKHVGHLFISMGISFVLFLLYMLFLQYQLTSEQDEINNINNQISTFTKDIKNAKIKTEEVKKINAKLEEELKSLKARKSSLFEANKVLPYIQSVSIKRQEMIDSALEGLDKFSLSIISLEQNRSKELKINIHTDLKKQTNIAEFVNYMAKKGYKKSYTNKIYYDENGTYNSIVEIER